MRLILIVSSVAVLASGCALRPRYADFVTSKTEGKEVTFLVTDAVTHQPVPNAKVELSELRSRINVTTSAEGTFKVPVEKKYLDENPVFVVTLPKGFQQYQLALAPPPAPKAVQPVEAPPVAPPAPAIEAAPDAGLPASNG